MESLLKSIRAQLVSLSDSEVEKRLLENVRTEREQTAQVVAHLAEVYDRKSFLKSSYFSLHQYAQKKLNYSASSAWRRTAAARLCLELPESLDKIANGELSLCVAAETWRTFEETRRAIKVSKGESVSRNKLGDRSECVDQTECTRESEYVGQAEPITSDLFRSGTTSDQKAQTSTNSIVLGPRALALSKKEKARVLQEVSGKSRSQALRTLGELKASRGARLVGAAERPRGKLVPVSKSVTELRVYLNQEQLKRFEELCALLSHSVPDQDPNKIFNDLLELGLEKYCPKRKQKRANERVAKKAVHRPRVARHPSNNQSRRAKSLHPKGQNTKSLQAEAQYTKTQHIKTRHIPARVDRTIRTRSGAQCEYVDPKTGVRCESTKYLERDHVHEFAKGGGHDENNLRLLCSSHHRHRKVLGI